MTLPLFLLLHVVYGTVIGLVLFPRMRAEGEVLGAPLLLTLVPVALVTAPVGAVFLRYCGGWFLHGYLIGDGSITYERFHFGLLLALGFAAALSTVGGVFNVVAFISRDRPAAARLPIYFAVGAALAVLVVDGANVLTIRGTGGRMLWAHPAGLLSLALVVVLVGWVLFARQRLSHVPRAQGGTGSGPSKRGREVTNPGITIPSDPLDARAPTASSDAR